MKRIALLLIIVFAMLPIGNITAQEATEDIQPSPDPVPTIDIFQGEQPGQIVPMVIEATTTPPVVRIQTDALEPLSEANTGIAGPDLEPGDVVLNVGQIIAGVIAAVTAGGIIGVAGAGVLANRLLQDKATVTAMEKLADSLPPETTLKFLEFFMSVESVANLGTEVFDDVPIVDKPAE